MTNTILSDQARQAKNEYMKQWRQKNSEKLKVYNKRYWERQAKLKDQANDSNMQEVSTVSMQSTTSDINHVSCL